ncbi:hypothetical protein ACU6S5_19880, partial [Acinetobacter baumannii]|uniref:hypothetical protein n=1 Tax=Acinetobacter baumannii TaxID=470 RepID=UPI00406C9AA5
YFFALVTPHRESYTRIGSSAASNGYKSQPKDAPAKICSILLNLASFKLPKPAPIKMKGQKQLMPF